MSDEKDHMGEVLKEKVIPLIRNRGFTGSFPHFKRVKNSQIDLITFQFDKWGSGFVVEIAKCLPGGTNNVWGKKIDPKKVTAWDIHPDNRLRLGSAGEEIDYWFRYDTEPLTSSRYTDIAEKIINLLDSQAEKWWSDNTVGNKVINYKVGVKNSI